MRPLELRLRNFRSFYGDDHKFDFRDRRLIGIVGPIGSGKSTILDAVAFALYGRTPRIGRATKSLIHQRADHAAVSLRFEIEGDVWEAVRNLRRTGPSQHALYRLPEDRTGDKTDVQPDEKVALERDVNQRIEELLGLDFHGFGRSVLLAQGDFAQFLNARPAERDKVLKGVFGYDRVGEIRELARDAVRRADHEIEKLKIHIDHAEEAKARLDQRRDELAAADRRHATLREVRPDFEQLIRRIRGAEELRECAAERLAVLDERSGELPDPVAGEQVLQMSELVRDRRVAAERELGIATGRLETAKAALDSDEYRLASQSLDRSVRKLAELEAARDRLEARLVELQEGEAELPDLIKGIKDAALAEYAWARRVEARGEWEDAEERLGKAEATLSSEEFIGREQRVGAARDLIIHLRTRNEAVERVAREAEVCAVTLRQDDNSEVAARSALTQATVQRRESAGRVREAESRVREAEGRLHDARHADMAGTLRDRIEAGETCPVCEQPVYEVPLTTAVDTSAAEADVRGARAERGIAEEQLRDATGLEQAAKAELGAAIDRVVESRERLQAAHEDEERQAHLLRECHEELAHLIGEGDPEVRLEEERAALDAIRASAGVARKERDEKRAALDAAMGEEQLAEKALSDLRMRIGTLGSKLSPEFGAPEAEPGSIRAALSSLHSEWRLTVSLVEDTLGTQREKIEAASARQAEEQACVELFRTEIKEARANRDRALKVRDEVVESERNADRRLSELRAVVERLGVFLEPDFRVTRGDPTSVRAALVSLHAAWKRTATDLERTVAEQQVEFRTATERLDEKRATYRIKDSIEVALAEVRADRKRIQAGIEQDEVLVAGVAELRQQRRTRRKDARLNRRLARDLTDSRFIRFLLDEERAILGGLGSEHFQRLSSGRYRFTEDGTFDVVDLNSADAVRRADSLSGGETFLASLALALGLAEMVGRRGGRLDAFFLDEGFGTLDPEHLDLAMEGIESLAAHREQRLVVIVSHVPEIRERIEDLMKLSKHPITGDSELMS